MGVGGDGQVGYDRMGWMAKLMNIPCFVWFLMVFECFCMFLLFPFLGKTLYLKDEEKQFWEFGAGKQFYVRDEEKQFWELAFWRVPPRTRKSNFGNPNRAK